MRSVWKFSFFDKHIFRTFCKLDFDSSNFRSRRSFFFFEVDNLAIMGKMFLSSDI